MQLRPVLQAGWQRWAARAAVCVSGAAALVCLKLFADLVCLQRFANLGKRLQSTDCKCLSFKVAPVLAKAAWVASISLARRIFKVVVRLKSFNVYIQ